MHRKTAINFFLICVLLGSLPGTLSARRHFRPVRNLWKYVAEGQPVSVCFGSVRNTQDNSPLTPDLLVQTFSAYMRQRNTETFQVVETAAEADLVMDITVLEYTYSDKDPVDQLVGGATGLVLDAAVTQAYVAAKIQYTVTDPRKNRAVWKKTLPNSVTAGGMTAEDAPEKVARQAAKNFIFQCFGKPKGS